MKRPALKNFRRIVVKVGSSLLIDSDAGEVRSSWLAALAAEEPGIVGYALTVTKGSKGCKNRDRVYIERLAVLPNHRRKGVASALIEAICTRAELEGKQRVMVLSSEFAPVETHKFFAHRGFWVRVHPAPERIRRPLDTPRGEERRGVYVFTRMASDP